MVQWQLKTSVYESDPPSGLHLTCPCLYFPHIFALSVGNKTRAVSSGYGSVRNTQSGIGLNKKKVDTYISR